MSVWASPFIIMQYENLKKENRVFDEIHGVLLALVWL
jgi:hypothetical protein